MTTTHSQKIQAGMGALMAAVGAIGTLMPDRLNPSATSDPADVASRYQTQLWTLRESALGLVVLGTLRSPHRRRVLGVVSGLALAEVVVNAQSPALSASARSSAVGTAAVFGVAGACALLLDRAPRASALTRPVRQTR